MIDYLKMDKEKLIEMYEKERYIIAMNTHTNSACEVHFKAVIESCNNLKEICKNIQGIETGYRTIEERIALDKQRIKNHIFTNITDKDISTEIVPNGDCDGTTRWEQFEVIYTITSYTYSDVARVRDPVILHACYYVDNLKLFYLDVVSYPEEISQNLLCTLYGLERFILKLDTDKENENI